MGVERVIRSVARRQAQAQEHAQAQAPGGFTLVEMLAAMMILAFGITTVLGVMSAGLATERNAELIRDASRLATAVREDLEHGLVHLDVQAVDLEVVLLDLVAEIGVRAEHGGQRLGEDSLGEGSHSQAHLAQGIQVPIDDSRHAAPLPSPPRLVHAVDPDLAGGGHSWHAGVARGLADRLDRRGTDALGDT